MSMPSEKKPYTYADYLSWSEGRWELIDGIVYDMSPAPSTEHQRILGKLHIQLFSYFENNGDCELFVAPFDVRLDGNEQEMQATHVVQPDLTVICDKAQLDEKGYKGVPALIIEILSPSTALKDRNEKFKLYEKMGVNEYWIVDPFNKTVEVYGENLNGRFSKRDAFGRDNNLISFFFEKLELDLANIF